MNYYENPDLEWYKKISAKNKVPPRCHYTMLYTCPIYFESIELLKNTGAKELDKNDEEKLIKYWKDRELNPSLLEETPGVLHHKTKGFSSLHNFCPEAIYLRFGYFASFISNFEDETDQAIRHFDLKKRDISLHSWAWNWSNLKAKHYTDCRLYSILSNPKKNKVVDNIINNNQERNKIEENNKEPKIFLSYSHRNKEIADRVDKFFISKNIRLTRDVRDAPAYSSLKKFMDTIRDHDYVIMLISDAYLKSINCMYEVIQFIQERNYIDRTFPIVIDNEATIFDQSKHSKYIHYWQTKYKELGDEIKILKNTGTISLHKELDKIDKIQSNIGEFLDKIAELKCFPIDELESTNYKAILDKIGKPLGVFPKEEIEVEGEKLKLRIIGCLYKWYVEGLERGITLEFNTKEKINEWEKSSKLMHNVIDEMLDDGYIERSSFGHVVLTKQGRLLARKEKLEHKYDYKQCGKGD